jgi:hypothetical protein
MLMKAVKLSFLMALQMTKPFTIFVYQISYLLAKFKTLTQPPDDE